MANPAQPALDILAETPSPEQAAATAERDRVREQYRARLAEKLKDPEFRKIDGFPIGTDEAILALSDPPYYTACPNPFIDEWLQQNAKPYDPESDDYHREPFAADVSEGKSDPIYNAHSYHTKVPHKAIMRYIMHYTEPGDVVFDGFCGTGMTGVAATMCGNKSQVESLFGYKVRSNAVIDGTGVQISELGMRKAILNDLSPIATFIANNYADMDDTTQFVAEALKKIDKVEESIGSIYQFNGGKVLRAIWSDMFVCPGCSAKIDFGLVSQRDGELQKSFLCPNCRIMLGKSASRKNQAKN